MAYEVVSDGVLGAGSEQTPVRYPRSNDDRALSNNNKGGASVSDGPGTVDYTAGPYPKIEDEADVEGSGTA